MDGLLQFAQVAEIKRGSPSHKAYICQLLSKTDLCVT